MRTVEDSSLSRESVSVRLTVVLLSSDPPEDTETLLSVDEPDSSKTVPSTKPGETAPYPGPAESHSGPTETQKLPEPAGSTSTEDQSRTTRLRDSKLDPGPDLETKDQIPAGVKEEAVQLTPEGPEENTDVNKVNGNEETTDNPDSAPKSQKKSRTGSPGKGWRRMEGFFVFYTKLQS